MAMPCNGCTYYTYFPGLPPVPPPVPPMGPGLDQKSWVSLSDGCTYYPQPPVPPTGHNLDGKSWVPEASEVPEAPEASKIQDILSEVHRAAAAIKIQAAYRGYIVRKRLRKSVAAAIKIQSTYRGHIVRKRQRDIVRKTVYNFEGGCWGHVIGITPKRDVFVLSNDRICKLATYGFKWRFSDCSREQWITKDEANSRNPAYKTKPCNFGRSCNKKDKCNFVHPGEKFNKVGKRSVNYDIFPANMVPLLKALPIMDPPPPPQCVVVRK